MGKWFIRIFTLLKYRALYSGKGSFRKESKYWREPFSTAFWWRKSHGFRTQFQYLSYEKSYTLKWWLEEEFPFNYVDSWCPFSVFEGVSHRSILICPSGIPWYATIIPLQTVIDYSTISLHYTTQTTGFSCSFLRIYMIFRDVEQHWSWSIQQFWRIPKSQSRPIL